MNNKELLVLKIIDHLVSNHNYRPMKIIGGDGTFFLENAKAGKYPILNISAKDEMPDKQLSEEHAKKILSKVKKERLILSGKIGVIAFGPALLKYETKSFDVFMCTNDDLPAELFKQFPDLKDVIKNFSKTNITPAIIAEEKTKVQTQIKASVITQTINDTKEISNIIRSRSKFSIYLLIALLALPILIQTTLIGTLPAAMANDPKYSGSLWYIVTGASYAPMTFGLNEFWRLGTAFFINDPFSAIILVMILWYSQILEIAESLYGKIRTWIIIIITASTVTLLETVANLNALSYGSMSIIFISLAMLLYYGYYNKMIYKIYVSKGVKNIAMMAILTLFFFPESFFGFVAAFFIGILLSSIVGFKNSRPTIHTLVPVFSYLSIVGGALFLQFTHKMGSVYYDETFGHLADIYHELKIWNREEFLNALKNAFK